MNGFSSRLWACASGACPTGAAIIAMVGAFSALPAHGGDGVINVNQHKTQEYVPAGDTCANPSQCQVDPLPEDALGQYSLVDANAYHVRGGDAGECKFAKARCKYRAYSKPKIISSDDGYVSHADAHHYMEVIAGRPVGTFHYEYWDKCLSEYAKRSNVIPDTIPGHDPFPSTPCPGYGAESSQAMAEWIAKEINGVVSEDATILLQNGWLHRDSGSPVLKWKAKDPTGTGFVDDAKRLMGFGYMGALGAGPERLLAEPYMRALRLYNINFTRVWAIEAWTALRTPRGPMPFPLDANNKYGLWEDNPVYYNHLRNFAQQAADRGIVIQHSLFDKHGLIYHDTNFQYKDSPYRDDNNNDSRDNWLESIIPDPDCGPQPPDAEGRHPFPDSVEEQPSDCQPLYSFIEDADMALVHKRFIRRTAEEVGGIGNMMFEIINEAIAPGWPEGEVGDWADDAPPPSTTTKNQQWQMDMAKELRLALPLAGVARDAFNGDDDETSLGNKRSDVEWATWWAGNAEVRVASVEGAGQWTLGDDRKLGYVTSAGTDSSMWGSLPLSSGSVPWTKLQVRADLTLYAPGTFELGFQTTWQDAVFLRVSSDPESIPYHVSLVQRNYPNEYVRGTFTIGATTHHYRLRVRIPPGDLPSPILRADVFVDGELMIENAEVGTWSGYTRAFFKGWDPTLPIYPPERARIDNFEAARFCDDALRGCTLN